ncbi:MAG: hypothetical protein WBB07_24050 [Mycobacterium sp.]
MGVGWSLAVAAVFVWLGMVLAISFLEAPLKFRAPGVTLAVGLGIGRLVFRALNCVEAVLATVVVAGAVVGGVPVLGVAAAVTAAGALAVQVLAVRPALSRRSNTVLAGGPALQAGSRSQAHYAYVMLEMIKVIALAAAGLLLLAG